MDKSLAQTAGLNSLNSRLCRAALVLALMAAAPAEADEPSCALEEIGTGTVAAIPDAQTVELSDGTQVRLMSVLTVTAHDASDRLASDLEQAARSLLRKRLLHREVIMKSGGRQIDRHGRQLAHLFLSRRPTRWIQAELVDSGLARVYSFADNRGCVARLLEHERAARRLGRGLWASKLGTILRTDRPATILRRVGSYAIVEGRIISVGERRARTYLNFGTYWNEDFTVYVTGRDRERFAEAGIELGALTGKLARVRGWILDDRGPAVEATHPEQIEIVADR